MQEASKLLIIDDERIALRNLEYVMKKEGYDVTSTQSGANALKLLEEQKFDVVLTDLRMEKVDGMQILRRMRELYPDTEVIMITGYATLDSAVETMKHGAFYYIAKPFKLDEVRKVVVEALQKVRRKTENRHLLEQLESDQGKVKIITQDPTMQKLLETSRQIAPTDCNVLITGEKGTGKELFAQYIHYNSKRGDGPFYSVDCGAFTEDLLANELFGYEQGVLNGSNTMKKGLIEMSSGGTLFIDEVTTMPQAIQLKILRVVQDKEVTRIGGTTAIKIDVRFVAATNRDVHDAIKSGSFQESLYFRLNIVSLRIPPLSERENDIPLLSYFFLQKHALLMKKEVKDISEDVIAMLMNYDFPGNVRELENIIERGVAMTKSNVIDVGHLPEDLRDHSIKTFRKKEGKIQSLDEQEEAYIKWVLNEVGGNKTLAAQILGIDRVSLWRKLKKYGLESG
jgi:DNA-binding NtrC family response regulator